MWQEIHADLKHKGFTIIAVAMDSDIEAARPWIEAAKPGYPALIDRSHLLADLYNMVNVPQAVWIDEDGRIVRPTENAGAFEAFRARDKQTGEIPQPIAEKRDRARALYRAAIYDWVEKGAASDYAFDAAAAEAHVPDVSADTALAHAHFRLGQHLIAAGNETEGRRFVEAAIALHPDSWNMYRQNAEKLENGLAAGADFWERVNTLEDGKYYPLPDMAGMPG